MDSFLVRFSFPAFVCDGQVGVFLGLSVMIGLGC